MLCNRKLDGSCEGKKLTTLKNLPTYSHGWKLCISRILAMYEAKNSKICNFWTIWPVIQLINDHLQIWLRLCRWSIRQFPLNVHDPVLLTLSQGHREIWIKRSWVSFEEECILGLEPIITFHTKQGWVLVFGGNLPICKWVYPYYMCTKNMFSFLYKIAHEQILSNSLSE